MKTCTYCGKEYSDGATSCPIDGEPLESPGQPTGKTVRLQRLQKQQPSKGDVIGGLVFVLLGLGIGVIAVREPIRLAEQHVKGTIVVYFTLLIISPAMVLGGIVRALAGKEAARRWSKVLPFIAFIIGIVLCAFVLIKLS